MIQISIWVLVPLIIGILGFILVADYRIKVLEKELNMFKASKAYEVYLERIRQVKEEGYDVHKDKIHNNLGELAGAAAGYLETYLNTQPLFIHFKIDPIFRFTRNHNQSIYPWKEDKREQTPQRRKLIKASALILAELDRITH